MNNSLWILSRTVHCAEWLCSHLKDLTVQKFRKFDRISLQYHCSSVLKSNCNNKACAIYTIWTKTPLNNWIQVFYSVPLKQGYKIKHLQTFVKEWVILKSSLNSSVVLTAIECGCHCCNKSVCKISFLLDIPRITVSDIIEKWKCLGTTATPT